MNPTYRNEILTSALDARIKEVTEYQVNIDNFRLAIERIGNDPELQEFKQRLQDLLASSVLEQRKAKIMLDVVQSQLE
jgi:muramoyltetrapeptide carboxypeptidase LdcA involved in peptidoglycan recycling